MADVQGTTRTRRNALFILFIRVALSMRSTAPLRPTTLLTPLVLFMFNAPLSPTVLRSCTFKKLRFDEQAGGLNDLYIF